MRHTPRPRPARASLLTSLLASLLGCDALSDALTVEATRACYSDEQCTANRRCVDGVCALREAPPYDLAVPDLAVPDRALPDRAVPDHAVPDHALPDLALPDLGPEDQGAPEELVLPQRRCAVLLTADLVLDATDESRPLSAGERPRFACIDNTLMVLRRHPGDEEPPPGTSAPLAPFDLDAASGALVDLCEGKPDVRLAGEELTSLRLNYQDVSSRERLLSLAWLNPSSGPGLYLYDECDSRSPFFFDLSYGESYLSDGVTFAEYPRASLSLANSTAVSYPRAASRCRLSSSTSPLPPVHLWGLSLNATWRSWLTLELEDPSDARAPFSAWLNIAWDDAERVNDLGELNTLAAHCAPQRSFYLGVIPRSAPELRRHIYTRFDHTRGLFYCSLSAQGDCALHSWSYPRHADVPRGARVFVDGEPLTLPAARFDALGGFLVYEVPGDAPPYAPLLKVAYSPSPAEGVDGTERLEYLSRGEVSTSGLELGQLELLYAPKEGSQGFKERVVWLYWVERVDRVNEQRVKESSWRLRAEPLAPPVE